MHPHVYSNGLVDRARRAEERGEEEAPGKTEGRDAALAFFCEQAREPRRLLSDVLRANYLRAELARESSSSSRAYEARYLFTFAKREPRARLGTGRGVGFCYRSFFSGNHHSDFHFFHSLFQLASSTHSLYSLRSSLVQATSASQSYTTPGPPP